MGTNASENSLTLKRSKNRSLSPRKFKNSQSMSPKWSQNSGQRLWNALEASINVGEELKKIKLEIELKKDAEISEKLSNEGIEKVVELEGKIEKEIEEIATPISILLLREMTIKLQGREIIKLAEKLEKQVKEMQELCNKLELNAKIEEEDLSKLKSIKEESEKSYKELMNYMPNSNPVMLYTAVIGIGFAAGLLVSTALDHTTKLSTLAIIGIVTASALVAGGATYQALRPNTQVNESREVQRNYARGEHH